MISSTKLKTYFLLAANMQNANYATRSEMDKQHVVKYWQSHAYTVDCD
jgi:hypothetical protein